MKVYLKKSLSGLSPAFDSDKEKIQTLSKDVTYQCTISQPRNLQFHRKFMALINMAFRNQDVTEHFDAFRRWMIIEAGRYDRVKYPDGTEGREAHSISFAKMSEQDFRELYKDLIQVVIIVVKADEAMIESELVSFM